MPLNVLDINTDIINPYTGTTVTINGIEMSTNGTNNINLGEDSGQLTTTGQSNTSLGVYSMQYNTTSLENVAIGSYSLSLNDGPSGQVAIGSNALKSSNGGASQTAVGRNALFSLTTGSGLNTAVGHGAGYFSTSGSSNVFIGASSALSSTTGSNNICLGTSSNVPSATTDNSITLGNASHTVLRCAVTSITSLSDARDKKDVAELTAGLDFVKELNPVSFVWDDRDEDGKHDVKDFGFIAQDLKATQEKYDMAETLGLVYEENPEKLEASYGKLIPILVKAIKELSSKVEALESKKK